MLMEYFLYEYQKNKISISLKTNFELFQTKRHSKILFKATEIMSKINYKK